MKRMLLAAVCLAFVSAAAWSVELKLGHIYEPAHPWHIGVVKAA